MRDQYRRDYRQNRQMDDEPEMKRRARLHRPSSQQDRKVAMRRSILLAAICTICAVCGVMLSGGQ